MSLGPDDVRGVNFPVHSGYLGLLSVVPVHEVAPDDHGRQDNTQDDGDDQSDGVLLLDLLEAVLALHAAVGEVGRREAAGGAGA